MKFDAKFHPEDCVMGPYQYRPHMEHVWLDVAGKRLMATNGHLAIVIPCEVEADDVSGFIPVAAIEYARSRRSADGDRPGEIELNCRERIEAVGAAFDRPKPEKEFPPVDGAAAKQRRGDPMTVTFAVDARYLYELACALSGGDVDDRPCANVLVTVKAAEGGDQELCALHVESLNDFADARAVASLMPCRLPEKASALQIVPSAPEATEPTP